MSFRSGYAGFARATAARSVTTSMVSRYRYLDGRNNYAVGIREAGRFHGIAKPCGFGTEEWRSCAEHVLLVLKICWRVDVRLTIGDECRVGTRSVSDERARSVLIVDDDEVFGRALARALKAAGFIVALAEGGVAALEQLGRGVFSLILTDLQMPRMTGLELLRELRLRGIATPVIMMSGISEDRRGDALAAGAIAFLRKPFANSELVTLALTVARAQPVD